MLFFDTRIDWVGDRIVDETAKKNLYARLALGGLALYTAILVVAALDEYLGWGLLAPYF